MSLSDELGLVRFRLASASRAATKTAGEKPFDTLLMLLGEASWCAGYIEAMASAVARAEEAPDEELTELLSGLHDIANGDSVVPDPARWASIFESRLRSALGMPPA